MSNHGRKICRCSAELRPNAEGELRCPHPGCPPPRAQKRRRQTEGVKPLTKFGLSSMRYAKAPTGELWGTYCKKRAAEQRREKAGGK